MSPAPSSRMAAQRRSDSPCGVQVPARPRPIAPETPEIAGAGEPGAAYEASALTDGMKAPASATTITLMPRTPSTLSEIIEHKREEVARAKAATPLSELEAMVAQADPPRNLFAAVTRHRSPMHVSVIAEVKRRSPSAGLIRPEYEGEGFHPEDIARRYHQGGAAAISVLTDERFFGGSLGYIERVREAVPLPVLRKDFLIDPWQLWESRAAGADAVLLIAECLNESQIVDMLILSQQLQMTALLEVHDMENLLRVRPHVGFPHSGYCLLGINNRDLATMQVDLAHSLRLADMVEDKSVLVSESGIRSRADLDRLRAAGVRIVLVGEHLMRQDDPGAALEDLTRWRVEDK